MEGEREGDQEGDSWKPLREVRRECDSHKAARPLSTLQGVARQERVQYPSTSPKDGAGTPGSKPKTRRSQRPPTERKPQTPRTPHALLGRAPNSTKQKGEPLNNNGQTTTSNRTEVADAQRRLTNIRMTMDSRLIYTDNGTILLCVHTCTLPSPYTGGKEGRKVEVVYEAAM